MNVQLLSYCNTCLILRPPRSFHCRICNVCIEVHDHHCPYMGTCIGKRNIKYFILFLASASILCLVSFILCLCEYIQQPISIFVYQEHTTQWTLQVVTFIVMMYSGTFAFMLFVFALQNHQQAVNNVTTNEKLRGKWNARQKQQRVDCWQFYSS